MFWWLVVAKSASVDNTPPTPLRMWEEDKEEEKEWGQQFGGSFAWVPGRIALEV